MERINNIASLEGRKVLRESFKELRFDQQRSSISSLFISWRLSTTEKEFSRYVSKDTKIQNPLGLFGGTGVWMEEVVNRFYFSTVNSFVYFGAAILLVLIGLRRFNDNIGNDFVIGGIIFEAALLLFLFIVMLFSPSDEAESEKETEETNNLILEIGEISRDFAAVVIHLEKMSSNLEVLISKQNEMIDKIDFVTENTNKAVSPNNEMLETMKLTTNSIKSFKETVEKLNISASDLKNEKIEHSVKLELEKYISQKINGNQNQK